MSNNPERFFTSRYVIKIYWLWIRIIYVSLRCLAAELMMSIFLFNHSLWLIGTGIYWSWTVGSQGKLKLLCCSTVFPCNMSLIVHVLPHLWLWIQQYVLYVICDVRISILDGSACVMVLNPRPKLISAHFKMGKGQNP